MRNPLASAMLLVSACGVSGGPVGQGAVTPAPFAIRSTLALVTTRSGYSDVAIIYSDLPLDCDHAKDEITLPPPNDVNTFTLAPAGSAFTVGTFQRAGSGPIAFQTHLSRTAGEQEPLISSAGTVVIGAVGASVTGTFQAQMVHSSDGSDAGTYSGTFDAPLCHVAL